MADRPSEPAPPSEVDEVRQVWNANAAFWDARMGEGNDFHRTLLLPGLDRLLGLRAGERVLEIACGNGQLARWMSSRGARVLATDLSDELIAIARTRPSAGGYPVEYQVVDACDPAALRSLGAERFDAVVCNMALMDMPTIAPLARALPGLLGPAGRFVASVTHPCFNTGDTQRVARWSEEGGVVRQSIGVETHRYRTPRKLLGSAILGQPRPQPYYERPLRVLVGEFLAAGLVLDALEEPAFPAAGAASGQPWFSWSASLSEIPPALLVRFVRRSP